MKRNSVRGFVAVALIALVCGGVTLWSRHHRSATKMMALASARGATANLASPTAPHPPARPTPTTQATIAVNPATAAAAWLARADSVVAAKRARTYGPDVAALMNLPPAQAWAALSERGRDGDASAATAATTLAMECERLLELRALSTSQSHRAAVAAKNLPDEWRTFAEAIDAQYYARIAQRTSDCTGVGNALDFAAMTLDRFFRSDDPQVQLEEATTIEDDAEAIADLRQLADRLGTEEARRDLGMRLIKSRDAAESAEGRALLESLAGEDELAATSLAACLRDGCGASSPDPKAARSWLERAAGLGSLSALAELINDLVTSGNFVEAWAWAGYRFDLASAACFEFGQPTPAWIIQTGRDAFRLGEQLSAIQQAQGNVIAQSIRQHWQALAMTNLGCAE
jgi:hypothetical protein